MRAYQPYAPAHGHAHPAGAVRARQPPRGPSAPCGSAAPPALSPPPGAALSAAWAAALPGLFRATQPGTIGFLTYSEGCNDDVNKAVWSALGWDPEADVLETLRDYSRYFIGDGYADATFLWPALCLQ